MYVSVSHGPVGRYIPVCNYLEEKKSREKYEIAEKCCSLLTEAACARLIKVAAARWRSCIAEAHSLLWPVGVGQR